MTVLDDAIAAHQRGDLPKARSLYDAALAKEPSNPDALALKGVLSFAQGDFAEAEALILRALKLDPNAALFWIHLGDLYRVTERWQDAVAAYQNAAEKAPSHAPSFFFLGLSLSRLDRHEEALRAFRRTIELAPQALEAFDNYALTLQVLGRNDEALAVFHELLRRAGQDKDDTQLLTEPETTLSPWHDHLSLLELRLGDYRRGFARYRSRFASRPRPSFPAPLWRGEPLQGRTLLVYTEQGFGDALMFARFLPLLKQQGARVLFQSAAPIVPLFKNWAGLDEMLGPKDQSEGVDYVASIFDLPLWLGVTLESVPRAMPYLPCPAALEISAPQGKLKIGVLWRGNPANGTDHLRSLPLPLFASVFQASGAAFYSLCRDPTPDEMALLQANGVTDLGTAFAHFGDTAAAVAAMDAVIACDTAVAHLAGGLGKPVFTLLPFDPDWRWGFDQKRAVWYPSMRLLRQLTRGDWGSALAQLPAAWTPDTLL